MKGMIRKLLLLWALFFSAPRETFWHDVSLLEYEEDIVALAKDIPAHYAINAETVAEVRNGGSDTANGGTFNFLATFDTTGAVASANTSSPVLTATNYSWVAGDVGKIAFLKAGTNLIPGMYTVASVSAGAATLTASVGSAVLYTTTQISYTGFNTVTGCSASPSLTTVTWGMDYSQQTAAQFAPTTYTSNGSATPTITMTWSGATKNMIGNGLVIPSGVTNATAGYYQITAVTAGTSLVLDKNWNSGVVATGGAAIGIGGAFASLGQASSINVSGVTFIVFVAYNATPYTISSASTGVAGGCVNLGGSYVGYNTSRFLGNLDALRPTLQVGAGVSAATIVTGNVISYVANFIMDGNSQTTSRGVGHRGINFNVKFINFTNGATVNNTTQDRIIYCEITSCSTVAAAATFAYACTFHGNTVTGCAVVQASRCIAYANTGSSSFGISLGTGLASDCIAYGNGISGFGVATVNSLVTLLNCISEGNGVSAAGFGYSFGGSALCCILVNCADYNNLSGRNNTANVSFLMDLNPIRGSGSFFTNAAGGVFSLNNTAGAGALCRAACFPSLSPDALTPSYNDAGGWQHQDAGGGGLKLNQSMTGGLA